MRDLLIIVAVLAVIPIALTRPYIAVPLWAWTSLLGPNDFLYGLGRSVPFVKVAAGVTILSLILSKEKKSLYVDRSLILVLLFLTIATISQGTTSAPTGWEIYDKLWKMIVLYVI